MRERLRKYAMSLGAVDAKIIATSDVVVENKVVLKCRYWCENFGANWSCPPFVPSPNEFRSILEEYEHAMIVKFASSINFSQKATNPTDSLIRWSPYETYSKELSDFYKIWNEDKRRVHENLLKLEKLATKVFPFALALRPGSCNVCDRCDVKKPCVHPEKLRFSPEAVGVNLIKTLKNAGISLSFPCTPREPPALIAMLLIS